MLCFVLSTKPFMITDGRTDVHYASYLSVQLEMLTTSVFLLTFHISASVLFSINGIY